MNSNETALTPNDGFNNVNSSDLGILFLTLTQDITPEVKEGVFKAGVYACKNIKASWEKITGRLLSFEKGRTYFQTGKPMKGQAPRCKSDDGLYPSKDIEQPINDVCIVIENGEIKPMCPMSKKDNVTNKIPCRFEYRLPLIMDSIPDVPFILPFHTRSGREQVKNFIKQTRIKCDELKAPLCDLKIEISAKRGEMFYIPVFNIVGYEPSSDIRKKYSIFKSLSFGISKMALPESVSSEEVPF